MLSHGLGLCEEPLTPAEQRVIQGLLLSGASEREIAVDLQNGVGSDAHAPRSVGTCSLYTPPVSRTELVVHSRISIAAGYPGAPSIFGAPLPAPGVSGSVVRALDDAASGGSTDGCAPLLNGADISGNIALIDRGTCSFTVKVRNAQDAGAIVVIVADNVAGTHPGMTGSDPAITIPSLIVTLATGNALKARWPTASVPVSARRSSRPRTRIAGCWPRILRPSAARSATCGIRCAKAIRAR